MFMIVTFLTLLCHLRVVRSNFRTCVPNTQFILNDRICHCDGRGQWSDASCLYVSHKQLCQPGQIVWHGCSQCVCQDNGQLLCNNLNCPDVKSVSSTKGLNSIGHWCTPFRVYYVDCNICVCPESGRTANVQCVKDSACTALRTPSITDLLGSNKNTCKPKVLYVFSCLQCLCSDEGVFVLSNCVETCPSKPSERISLAHTCTPHSFYRNDCNVCLCPTNGVHADASCTQELCDGKYKFKVLQALTSEVKTCTPQQFTPPKCLYCHCNPEGTINQQTCLELNCLNTHFNEYNVRRSTCSPGEMVPFCTECFCLRKGTTHKEYCTRGCSYRNKIQILEKVFKDSKNQQLLDLDTLDKTSDALTCKHNSIYIENGKYCLCPDSETKEKSCIVAVKKAFNFKHPALHFAFKETKITIDFKKPCTPSTFVEFDCNTCFCSKNGTIDPNWCTYDDCEAKRIILESQKAHRQVTKKESDRCTPGSITEVSCNFCICPENGLSKDKACTKNRCADVESGGARDNFDCAPLEYYEVDCNICSCPRDGIKNVRKCTQNICENNFLRADACVPGRLFSEECNICICPPDGTKRDRVCTKHDCKKAEMTWKRIFKLSNSIIEEVPVDGGGSSKKLDLCFPGEEFTVGGHFCVCPEMGLRTFATCSDMVLSEGDTTKTDKKDDPVQEADTNKNMGVVDSFAGSASSGKLPQLQQLVQQPKEQLQLLQQQQVQQLPPEQQLVQQQQIQQPLVQPPSQQPEVQQQQLQQPLVQLPLVQQLVQEQLVQQQQIQQPLVQPPSQQPEVQQQQLQQPLVQLPLVQQLVQEQLVQQQQVQQLPPEQQLVQQQQIQQPLVQPPSQQPEVQQQQLQQPLVQLPLVQRLVQEQLVQQQQIQQPLVQPPSQQPEVQQQQLQQPLVQLPLVQQLVQEQLVQQQQVQPHQQQQLQQQPALSNECYIYNNTATGTAGARCASGSLYIKGCQQCLCPLVGDMIEYCRSLNTTQCNATGILSNMRSSGDRSDTKTIDKIPLAPHLHTRYKCEVNGRVRDACYVCECEQDSVIREHCFSSTAVACVGVEPTFLREKL